MRVSRLLVVLALLVFMVFGATSAFAAEKNITTAAELKDAIENQADGDIWNLAAGATFELDAPFNATINGVTADFAFPIYANNLSINGNGATITSTWDPNSGVWSSQNFITIKGAGVNINNVKLLGNPNSYYGGQTNKVIELIDGGKDLTLKDVTLMPRTTGNETVTSGSIYINVNDAGDTLIENVTLNDWINARAVATGTVGIKNVVFDFTNNEYAGYSDSSWGYAWNPGTSSADGSNAVVIESQTIKVDNNTNFVKQIVDNLRPQTTIELTEDIELTEMAHINGIDNVTILGNGHTITAADSYAAGSAGQMNLVKVQESANVLLKDLTIKTKDMNRHALDAWKATDLVLDNVNLDHGVAATGAPLINNGSSIIIENELGLVTGPNSWYGINVDNKYSDASILFKDGASINYDGDKVVIYPENTDPNNQLEILNPGGPALILHEDGYYIFGATSLAINEGDQELEISDVATLTLSIEPSNAATFTVVWESSNPEVATVDQNGIVSAVGAGTATITARNEDSSLMDSVEVVVNAPQVDEPGVTNPSEEETTTKVIKPSKTGDNAKTGALALAAILAAAGAIALVVSRKKRLRS